MLIGSLIKTEAFTRGFYKKSYSQKCRNVNGKKIYVGTSFQTFKTYNFIKKDLKADVFLLILRNF